MNKIIGKMLKFSLVKLVGRDRVKQVLPMLASFADIDLLTMAYNSIGILNYENDVVSGERFFISKILKDYLKGRNPVLFDVGANIGQYSLLLLKEFPDAKIYSFEPNINTFQIQEKFLSHLNIYCFNLGLGSKITKARIYTYISDKSSQHSSIHKNVFLDLHKTEKIEEMEFDMTTLDKFCADNKIDFIDFLKIDVEGNELDVMKGATELISGNKIGIIQFEFNEMNIISKVFLRDFYKLLSAYKIYRLDTQKLIPLFEYDSRNEIFQFQNLIAINKICFNDV